jgi:Mannosyltransferase (PIG-V)
VTTNVASERTAIPLAVAASASACLRRVRPWWPALRYCGSVYLVIRLVLFALSAAAWGLTTEKPSVEPSGAYPTLTEGWHNAITSWNVWDSLWFLQIAEHGYSASNGSGAFYPGYPMLIRLVSYLCFGHPLVAAYIVSNGALVAALLVLYRLTEREYDLPMARRAVLYLCLFPTALFLFDTYSESLFLLAAVTAIALARRRNWGWAAVAGLAATLTRSTGVIVVLALAVEALHQSVEDRRALAVGPAPPGARSRQLATLAKRLGASVLPLAGTAGYLLFWQLRFHDWYQPIALEKTAWGRDLTAPWHVLWQGMIMAWRYAALGGYAWMTLDFVLVAMGLALGVWVALRARPVYAVYTWGSILVFLSESWSGRPLESDPRYLLPVFPLVWALARLGKRPMAHEAVLALSAATMAVVTWIFLTTQLLY